MLPKLYVLFQSPNNTSECLIAKLGVDLTEDSCYIEEVVNDAYKSFSTESFKNLFRKNSTVSVTKAECVGIP